MKTTSQTASDSGESPIATAILGLGTAGWFRWERLRLRDEFRVIAVWDADPQRRDTARQRGATVCDSLEALWSTNPHAVVIDVTEDSREHLIEESLQRGCHLLVEPPLAEDAATARRWWSLAGRSAGTLSVAQPARADEDYRAAVAAVASGRLGPLRSVRFLSSEWSEWPQFVNGAAKRSVFEVCGPEILDQLTGLSSERPTSVMATALPLVAGFTALLKYANGTTAQLDVRRNEFAPLRTGWRLSGERGGYRQQRLYTRADDGELIDEPVRLTDAPADAVLSAWLQTIRRGISATERERNLLAVEMFEELKRAIA